jgi:dihydrolipoamide dehydrogenase
MTKSYDVVVVGGGPGGYVAAIRAAQLGKKVAVIEENHMGGICLNWGCIPTKALLRSSEIYHSIKRAKEFGISVKDVSVDLKAIVKRSRGVAKQLSDGIGHLMKKHAVEVIDGRGKLCGKGKLKIEKGGKKVEEVSANDIIFATGARARVLPGLEPDGKQVLTYKEALVLDSLPKSLLVIGSGAIGIEFASFYQTLGSQVNVVEMADRILPVEDAEISAVARKSFESQGMKIHTQSTVESVNKKKSSVDVVLKDSDGKTTKLTVDAIITAVGIVPNSENLGFEGTQVRLDDRGHIAIDQWGATGEPGIYAIGDVAGAPWLAHKASHQAIVCVEKMVGKNDVHPLQSENIPGCTYCHPQIASVGLTEQAAKDAGHNVKVGRFPFIANGKAIAMGETDGLVKTVFNADTGELLGAHLIGAEVTEMISSFLVGKTMEATEADFMHTVFPHPTLSEMMHESVLDAYDQALHI